MIETRRAAHVAGIGETEYRPWGRIQDRNEFQLACQAIRAAADDCGIPLSELDGLATFAEPDIQSALLQHALGIPRLRFSASIWGGRGGASCGAVGLAAMAVEAGQANYVAVFRSLCQGQSRRYGRFFAQRMHASLTAPFGLVSAPQHLALVVQRYRHEFGLEAEHLASIALACRDNAQRNPRAVKHGEPLTPAQYRSGRMIAEPFRVYDCCLETDGACALIVTTAERARDLRSIPVRVLASVHGGGPEWNTGSMGAHNMPNASYTTGNQRELAGELFARAGVAPADIDVAQIYDHFTGMVLIALEDFGFCERGGAPAFVAAGEIGWPNGSLPINTAGGSLSEAYVHGLNHVVEGVRQLRGESTSQVADARLALVTGGSGVSPSSALVLAI